MTIEWLAGFFDGEGHSRTRGSLRIEISQRNLEILTEIHQLVGGRIYSFTQSNGKRCYKWYALNKDAIRIMDQLLPSLHVEKRTQYSLALERYISHSRRAA